MTDVIYILKRFIVVQIEAARINTGDKKSKIVKFMLIILD